VHRGHRLLARLEDVGRALDLHPGEARRRALEGVAAVSAGSDVRPEAPYE
jgi:hypothetical protein